MTPLGMRTVGVFLLVLCWWLFTPVPIGVSSFFGLALWVVVGVLPAKDAFGYFGHWINIFLIASFGIAAALHTTGAARRYALTMLNLSFIRGRPWRLFTIYFVACGILSAFTSNTASTIIFVSLALPLLETAGIKKGDKFALFFILSIAWAANFGGMITPVGTVINIVAMGIVEEMAGYYMGFGQWCIPGILIFITTTIVTILVVRYVMRPDISALKALDSKFLTEELKKMGPMHLGEKLAWGFLALAVICWMIPDPIRYISTDIYAVIKEPLNWGVTAIIIVTIMCMVPYKAGGERRTLLTFRDWAANVDLGTVSLVAICLALAGVLGNPETGIIETLSSTLSPVVSGLAPLAMVVVLSLVTVMMANFMSHMTSMTVWVLVGVTLSTQLGVGNPIALAVALTGAANMGGAFPSATTTTAIVYGTGFITIPEMLRSGLLITIISAILAGLIGYLVACVVFPWPV